MKNRDEIPVEATWDLTPLFKDQKAWENALSEVETLLSQIVANKGRITSGAKILYETLHTMDTLGIKLEHVAYYARLSFDVDMGNPALKANYEKLDYLYARLSEQLAFYEPELLQLKPEKFEAYKKELPELALYDFMFEKLFQQKDHVLSPAEEEIISRMSSLAGSFRKIFDDLTVNDLEFPEIIDENGEKIVANEVNYRRMLSSYNRKDRENFFKGLLGTYGSHINSLTSTLLGNIKNEVFMARTRKYSSSREMALKANFIPIEVYDTLINTVRQNVEPLQNYLELRRKTLGYQDLHFYDLFVPLVANINKKYSFEEAKDIVLTALKPLGEEYITDLKQAFEQRWVDIYPNKGKVSGAYAAGIYDLHPYSLLNFTGTPEDLFTMAHELGHVMHSYYSNKHQPYVDSDYVIFTAEVASTVNEYLLYRYLLEIAESKDEKCYLLSTHLDSIRSTLYRQAFFADFEMQLHDMVEKDIPLTPDTLCDKYRSLYDYYHGSGFTVDQELTYEWARIPHFYSSFYVYQYATGISAAIALAKPIYEKKVGCKEAYLNFLKQGGSDYPLNLLKEAGVDMSTSAPVELAIEDFALTLSQLEEKLQ
ncbi:MAG: oligoendopeptidase F [Peptococcia bacterium]